jgi:hypothetical protein
MGKNERRRQQYYQTIARFLFELRGTPFFLSPREIEALETWEENEIPLDVVLDGIKLAYESFRKKPGGRKKLTLVFCERKVLQSFEQYQERRVGQRRDVFDQKEKAAQLQRAVSAFLDNIPTAADCLEEIYGQVAAELAQGAWDENRLEDYERQAESLLLDLTSPRERKAIAAEIVKEHQVLDREELERLVRIKWLKDFRDRHKIPHLSLFYY